MTKREIGLWDPSGPEGTGRVTWGCWFELFSGTYLDMKETYWSFLEPWAKAEST